MGRGDSVRRRVRLEIDGDVLGNVGQAPRDASTELFIQLIVYSAFRLVQSFAASEALSGPMRWLPRFGVLALLVLVPALSGCL